MSLSQQSPSGEDKSALFAKIALRAAKSGDSNLALKLLSDIHSSNDRFSIYVELVKQYADEGSHEQMERVLLPALDELMNIELKGDLVAQIIELDDALTNTGFELPRAGVRKLTSIVQHLAPPSMILAIY